ncbi:hypothetical protein [Sphingobacterium sp. FBM7-1]|uniref:HU domain-containing protein n=1 Tax=Sphingobacterium sp. FBM7-1 TaxID=2886688 RepID=UPI001D10EDD8|nr:hypothetical protein [Sphingobacterium sp. FBM7-1]MCC2599385.1 hypothetical protein [Sphingobacterium sp. FBM7-1]
MEHRMNLGKNVYNLLKRQPNVFVKGLGSFKRNHTPAAYDDKRNVYLPPLTYIDFDRTSEQGYDFVQYIQQLELISREEAEAMVDAQVADLLKRVHADGQAKLDDLGHLVSYGDSYVFKALDLTGFHYAPVEAIAGQPQPVKVETPEPEPPAPQPVDEEPAVVAEVPSAESPTEEEAGTVAEVAVPAAEADGTPAEFVEEEVPATRSNTIWYVVIVLVALGIIVALYLTNQQQGASSTTQTPVVLVDSNANEQDSSALVLAGDSTGLVDSLGLHAADTGAIERPTKVLLVPEHHTWQIVIGSHKTLAQAYEQAESYNKAGYPKVRVIPSNLAKNRKKVIWDSYETKQEVDSALKYVQRHHIKDAWPDKIK